MKKKEKISYNHIMGIDLGGSTRMGIALIDNNNGELLDYSTIRIIDTKTPLAHRLKLIDKIHEFNDRYKVDILLYESIRLFSKGHIQLPTILSLNKVQTTIINEFSNTFPIYQVDVRSWKSRVLGNANLDKYESIKYVTSKFPQVNVLDEIIKPIKKETILELNHDLCDSICIASSLKFDYSILQDKNKQNYK